MGSQTSCCAEEDPTNLDNTIASAAEELESKVDGNTEQVVANTIALNAVEGVVLHNKYMAYKERSMIEENRALILQSFSAAFMGNRQMAKHNTDKIFTNRSAILDAIQAEDEIEENYRRSMLNTSKIDYLEHRSALNARVAEVSAELSTINSELISVNNKIMEGNAETVDFNTKHIAVNKAFFEDGLGTSDATPESNAQRIHSNLARVSTIKEQAKRNVATLQESLKIVNANRENIMKNADGIYERRKEIRTNHDNMMANATTVTNLISGSVSGEGARDRYRSVSDTTVENAKKIVANKVGLYALENAVMHNTFLADEQLSMTQENQALILKNYSAAFMGNRQMANQSTEQIFQNRTAILQTMTPSLTVLPPVLVDDAVQQNYRQSVLHEARVDYLEHRSALNARVAEVNAELASINAKLISVTSKIMEGNAEIVAFNAQHIALNKEFLDGGLKTSHATPESNEQRIASNSARMPAIRDRAKRNAAKLQESLTKIKANREDILKNAGSIYERRKEIENNHDCMMGNAANVAALITAN